MNINERLSKLEATNKPEIPLEWTEEEKQFRNDIHSRMQKKGATFYHEVCNEEEFERVKKLSSKACLIWYRKKLKSNDSV